MVKISRNLREVVLKVIVVGGFRHVQDSPLKCFAACLADFLFLVTFCVTCQDNDYSDVYFRTSSAPSAVLLVEKSSLPLGSRVRELGYRGIF